MQDRYSASSARLRGSCWFNGAGNVEAQLQTESSCHTGAKHGQGWNLQLDLNFKLPPAATAKPLRVSGLLRNLFKPKFGHKSPQSLRHRRWATTLGALGTGWPKPRTHRVSTLGSPTWMRSSSTGQQSLSNALTVSLRRWSNSIHALGGKDGGRRR
jgi:hypothetical protein